MTAVSARIIAVASAEASSTVQPHSVCSVARLLGIVSVYFRCPASTVDFSKTCCYLCLQTAKLSDDQLPPTSWLGGSTR